MTPSELADRLQKRWEAGARASTGELDYAAAAMLREAERLLHLSMARSGNLRAQLDYTAAASAWLDGTL